MAATTDHFGRSEIRAFRAANIPVVMLSAHRYPGLPLVGCDVRQGMEDLTRHLLKLGHWRLTLLCGRPLRARDRNRHWRTLQRVEGFAAAIRQAGGKVIGLEKASDVNTNAGRRILGEIVGGHSAVGLEIFDPFRDGREAMQQLLRRTRLPQAVLCANDDWAVGALAACAEAGVRVPQDIAITGFDNTSLGKVCAPPLTTVAQPSEAMAQKAVELLLKLIRGEKLARQERDMIQMPCRLIVRRSCGAASPQPSGSAGETTGRDLLLSNYLGRPFVRRHSRAGGNPANNRPASHELDSRFRGNDLNSYFLDSSRQP